MWWPCNKSNKQPAIGYSCGPAVLKMAYFTLVWQSKSSLQGHFSSNLQRFWCQQGFELNGLWPHNTECPYAALKSDVGCERTSSSEPLALVKQKGKKVRFNLLASSCLWVLDVMCHSPAQKGVTQKSNRNVAKVSQMLHSEVWLRNKIAFLRIIHWWEND